MRFKRERSGHEPIQLSLSHVEAGHLLSIMDAIVDGTLCYAGGRHSGLDSTFANRLRFSFDACGSELTSELLGGSPAAAIAEASMA